jgi:hypothetical protein
MSALPPDLFKPAPPAAAAGSAMLSPRGSEVLAGQWAALHAGAAVVAALAGRSDDGGAGSIPEFPAAIHRTGGQRLAVAGQGIADLSAMLEVGLRALLSVHARGLSPVAAAAALHGEFRAARDALLALVPLEHHPAG